MHMIPNRASSASCAGRLHARARRASWLPALRRKPGAALGSHANSAVRHRAFQGEWIVLVFIGYAVVLASVFGGYALMGGHLGSLFQPVEVLMIGGAGIGAFVVGNNGKAIRATLKELPKLLRSSRHDKALYMELMALL